MVVMGCLGHQTAADGEERLRQRGRTRCYTDDRFSKTMGLEVSVSDMAQGRDVR